MLQKVKGYDEVGIDDWSSHDWRVCGLKLLLKFVPIELPGQFYQGMAQVDDGLEFSLKKVGLSGGRRRLRLHVFSRFLQVIPTLNDNRSVSALQGAHHDEATLSDGPGVFGCPFRAHSFLGDGFPMALPWAEREVPLAGRQIANHPENFYTWYHNTAFRAKTAP